MIPRRSTGVLLILLIGLLPACGRRLRGPEPTLASDLDGLTAQHDLLPPFPEPLPSSGSLWTDAGPGNAMFRDTRAFRLNDLVTISLAESDTGSNGATTDLEKSSTNDFGVGTAFGLEDPDPQVGEFSLNTVLKSSTSSTFNGDGQTSRSNSLTATITARVARVLTNGDLVIAGQKTVVVNRERQVLTLVGSIRAVDINSRNRVSSSEVGDLTVRLWGRGEVDSNAQQGWFQRVMNRIWPF